MYLYYLLVSLAQTVACCLCGMKLKKHSLIHASMYLARCHMVWSKLQNLACWPEYIYRKPDDAGWYHECCVMAILNLIMQSVLRARLLYFCNYYSNS